MKGYFLTSGQIRTAMQMNHQFWASLPAALIVSGVVLGGVGVAAQSPPYSDPYREAPQTQPSQFLERGDQVFTELIKQNELRSARLREYSAVRIYSVIDLKGKVHARETVRIEYFAPDKKTFATMATEGSTLVRRMAFKPLIESEASAAAGKERHDSSITPANYEFNLLGQEDVGTHHCYVVEAIPKRKDKYLFEGKVWIDSREFAIVRIAGHPAKKLSFWITRANFVRQYEKFGDFWLPAKDETQVNVRIYGANIFSIEHHFDSINGEMSSGLTVQNPSTVDFPEKPRNQ